MFDVPFLFCALTGCAGMTIAVRHLWRGSVEFLPSMAWALLMALPFALEYPLMSPAMRVLHGTVVGGMTVLFLAGDWLAARQSADPAPSSSDASAPSRLVNAALAMAGAYFAITLTHIATADAIPFFTMLGNSTDGSAVDQARVAFSRNYSFLPGMRYVFSLATPLLGMPAVLLLWRCRRYATALIIYAWVILYCISGTAKGPLLLVMLITAVGALYMSRGRTRLKLARGLVLLAAASLIVMLAFSAGPAERGTVLSGIPTKYQTLKSIRPGQPMLLGGYLREKENMDDTQCTSRICQRINYMANRIILTPIEVSARWYEYFDQFPVQRINFGRAVYDSRSGEAIHPAQAVSRWAFHEPYPHDYAPNAYAYPSMDADAYGRYGMAGLIAAVLLYLSLRLAAARLRDDRAITQGLYYAVAVALFTMMPANASIQAMLIPHGLAPVMLALAGLWAWNHRAWLRARIQGLRITSV